MMKAFYIFFNLLLSLSLQGMLAQSIPVSMVAKVDVGAGSAVEASFQNTSSAIWVEKDANQQIKFNFVELVRSGSSIFLLDPSRSVQLELDLSRMKVKYTDASGSSFDLYNILKSEGGNLMLESRPYYVTSVANSYMSFTFNSPLDSDGCSNPGTDDIALHYKNLFARACMVHDLCYASPWRKAGIEGRNYCEKEFESNLYSICNEVGINDPICYPSAIAFYVGVEGWGLNAYNRGQAQADTNTTLTVGGQVQAPTVSHAITFLNGGGYAAWMEVSYIVDVTTVTKKTSNLTSIPGNNSESISIPIDAKGPITITLHGIATIESNPFFTKQLTTIKTDCVTSWGTIFDAEGGACGH